MLERVWRLVAQRRKGIISETDHVPRHGRDAAVRIRIPGDAGIEEGEDVSAGYKGASAEPGEAAVQERLLCAACRLSATGATSGEAGARTEEAPGPAVKRGSVGRPGGDEDGTLGLALELRVPARDGLNVLPFVGSADGTHMDRKGQTSQSSSWK
jgi:hypothetical protein